MVLLLKNISFTVEHIYLVAWLHIINNLLLKHLHGSFTQMTHHINWLVKSLWADQRPFSLINILILFNALITLQIVVYLEVDVHVVLVIGIVMIYRLKLVMEGGVLWSDISVRAELDVRRMLKIFYRSARRFNPLWFLDRLADFIVDWSEVYVFVLGVELLVYLYAANIQSRHLSLVLIEGNGALYSERTRSFWDMIHISWIKCFHIVGDEWPAIKILSLSLTWDHKLLNLNLLRILLWLRYTLHLLGGTRSLRLRHVKNRVYTLVLLLIRSIHRVNLWKHLRFDRITWIPTHRVA